MSRPEETEAEVARHARGAALAAVATVVILVFVLRAALEPSPSEGVPGPAEWARHEQTQPER